VKCERLTDQDLPRIRHLQPEGWPDITLSFRFYLDQDYCFPVQVTAGGRIIGLGVSVSLGRTAWVAHIIVDPGFRKQGIGYGIVEHLMQAIREQGIETALLIATELGEPVYVKAGFRRLSDYVFFKREQPGIEEPLSKHIRPYQTGFYPDIIRLDALATGEDRRRLFGYYLDQASVWVDDHAVRGFYIPGLGEGPIIADREEAGLDLMQLKYSTVNKAVLPAANLKAISWLRRMGFEEMATRGVRMLSGKEIPWHPEMIFSRIGGNLG